MQRSAVLDELRDPEIRKSPAAIQKQDVPGLEIAVHNVADLFARSKCRALLRFWDEYQAIINSPEIKAVREDQMDMTWRYWGYAFGAEFGGLVAGPGAMVSAGVGVGWAESVKAMQDWFSGF